MTDTTTRARLVLADDDVLLREGLATLLGLHGFEVAGRAGDVAELRTQVRECRPDVAVVDIRMPPTHTTEGLDAALTLRQEYPELGVLVLSAHVEVQQAMELMSGRGGRVHAQDPGHGRRRPARRPRPRSPTGARPSTRTS